MDLQKSTIAMKCFAFIFALGILGSMFGGGWGSPSPSIDYLKKTLDEKDFETVETENKAE